MTDRLVAAVVGTSFGARAHVPALRAAGSPPTPSSEDAWREQLVLGAPRTSPREGGRWIEIAAVR